MFEFDERKSQDNLAKHGIDFREAQRLWTDPALVETRARLDDEPRWLVTAAINGRLWSAVITYRGETIRIISVRRARGKEIERYESQGF